MNKKRIRRPLNIRKFDSELWTELRVEAVRQRRPVYEVLEDAVEFYLEFWKCREGKNKDGEGV